MGRPQEMEKRVEGNEVGMGEEIDGDFLGLVLFHR